jgi:hypothetical protein
LAPILISFSHKLVCDGPGCLDSFRGGIS